MKDLISRVLRECVDRFIILESEEDSVEGEIKNETDEIKNAKNAVVNRMKQLVAKKDENVLDILDNLGINADFNIQDYRNERNDAFEINGMINRRVSDEVQWAIGILRSFGMKDGGFRFESMRKKYPKDFNYLMKLKDLIDECGLSYTYDVKMNVPKNHRFGIENGEENGEFNFDNFDFNNIDDDYIKYWRGTDERRNSLSDFEALAEMKKNIVDRYMRAKYGMSLSMPKNVFAIGNGKLPKTTMIVNFTSAYRCPAWNECLVKHACYARSGEHRLNNVKDANDERSSMWLSAQGDDELMTLVLEMLRTYIVDYTKSCKYIAKKRKDKKPDIESMVEVLRKKTFFELDEIEKEAILKYRRITDIRLNENGDFIGAWLVAKWDEFAREFKEIGVNTTAYTCRHLNFNGIKNIIINASQMNIKGEAVARYFYCVSEKVYNAFDETYDMKGDKVVVNNKQINNGILPLYTYTKDGTNQIIDSNGRFYYKCPCGRVGSDGKKINCYQCNVCYAPNDKDKPYFVLVKAHGASKGKLGDIIPAFGVSRNFFNKYKGKVNFTNDVSESKKPINEGNITNDAYNEITNNAINSVYDHIGEVYNNNGIDSIS